MAKKHFLKTSLLVFSYLSCLVLSPPTHAIATQKINHKHQEKSQYCFVQSSQKAKIELHKKESNMLTITLKNVNPYVTYFTERPERNAGLMSIEEFIKVWNNNSIDSLKKDPPNADLHGIEIKSSNKVLNLVLELTNPQYNPRSKTLVYTAKILNTNTPSLSKSVNLEHVVLFIDDVCLSCW